MYQRILVPLDGSDESERVIPLVQRDLAPDGELILLHVICPSEPKASGGHFVPGSESDGNDLSSSMSYVRSVARRSAGGPGQCRCAVVIADSVCQGIVDFARRERVDVIAMSPSDRKARLARVVKKMITRAVQHRELIEVRLFSSADSAATA